MLRDDMKINMDYRLEVGLTVVLQDIEVGGPCNLQNCSGNPWKYISNRRRRIVTQLIQGDGLFFWYQPLRNLRCCRVEGS